MLTQGLPRGIYLLFLLNSLNGKKVEGRTRLEKLMFLIEKEVLKKEGNRISDKKYDFKADRFGPYTEQIFDDFETLKNLDLVDSDFDRDEFIITEKGKYLVNKIINKNLVPNNLLYDIENVKKKWNDKDLKKLLEYVYRNYEQYTVASEIRSKILGD